MAVLPMQRVSICALKKDRKAILEKIQSMGIMEMNQVAEGEEGFGTMDTVSARLSFDKKSSDGRAGVSRPGDLRPREAVHIRKSGGKGPGGKREV